jgi:arachidonate 15-lipoxygenase
MSAFLPQQDPHPTQRAASVAEMRKKYEYCYDYVSPLALVKKVPFQDEFSVKWLVMMAERALKLLGNHLEIEGDAKKKSQRSQKYDFLRNLISAATLDILGIIRTVEESLAFATADRQAQSLDDYGAIFRSVNLPPIARDSQEDKSFAYQRLAGPNSVMIHRVAGLDQRFPVTDEHLRKTMPNDSLVAAGAEGRLYLTDYAVLDGAEDGTKPQRKYCYAPLALFVLDKTSRALIPVAIQCTQQPGPTSPIFTPRDGVNWLIAKTIVETADGNVHEASTHLANSHLFMEPFVIASQRHLAGSHPLGLLLRAHFVGTLAINNLAHRNLIARDGAVDKMFSPKIESVWGLIAKAVETNPFNDVMLPATFKARGVDDPQLIRTYPYRDDSLLYWNVIRQWAADYLAIYYRSDADVAADTELAAWCRELIAKDGGRVRGFSQNGAISTLKYLTEAVTLIIYTCSVQHAAVNFPQFDLMSYVPNMPLGSFAPAPTSTTGATMRDYLNILPPLNLAEMQFALGYMLGTVHYTTLGQYSDRHFSDPKIKPKLDQFQERLSFIGGQIAGRNKTRRPYEFLVPSGVPQSINV